MTGKKSKQDWDVRTNLNPSPGSQGTLFSGGKQFAAEGRYPRGYTPERLHEVANAVGGSYAQGKGGHAGTFRDHPYGRYADNGEFVQTGRANNKPKRDLVDNIARSTVPVEHMTNTEPGRRLHFWVNDSFDAQMEAAGHLGNYQAAPPSHSNRHDIFIKTDAVRGATPIHEIGHHVSHMAGTEHSAYGDDHQRGREEAFADEYAQQHFRDRRTGKETKVGVYGGGFISEKRTTGFFDAYHAVRGTRRNGEWNQLPSDPQEHVKGQMPLVNKIENRLSDEEQMQVNLGKKKFQPTYCAEVNMEARPNYKPYGSR